MKTIASTIRSLIPTACFLLLSASLSAQVKPSAAALSFSEHHRPLFRHFDWKKDANRSRQSFHRQERDSSSTKQPAKNSFNGKSLIRIVRKKPATAGHLKIRFSKADHYWVGRGLSAELRAFPTLQQSHHWSAYFSFTTRTGNESTSLRQFGEFDGTTAYSYSKKISYWSFNPGIGCELNNKAGSFNLYAAPVFAYYNSITNEGSGIPQKGFRGIRFGLKMKI